MTLHFPSFILPQDAELAAGLAPDQWDFPRP
jgi:hypothetical protein